MKSNVRSPWIVHFDSGSCNGCDIEIFATLTPKYDIERFGALNKGNPKHADVLVITGPVTNKTKDRLLNLYSQIPEPKLVMAVGNCACDGKPFYPAAYNTLGGVDKVVPVDVYVPGCAARPEAIIDGVVLCLNKLQALLTGAQPIEFSERKSGRVVEVTMEKAPGDRAKEGARARQPAGAAGEAAGAKAAPKPETKPEAKANAKADARDATAPKKEGV